MNNLDNAIENSELNVEKKSSHKKEYVLVFIVLCLLTLLELAVADSHVMYWYRASSLILLALGKVFIVAYFYMHLKDETKWLKIIAAVPCASFVYATVLLLEMWAR